jgi:peptide/nickel transport system ATP-binding protein
MPPGCAFAPRCKYKMPICDEPVPLLSFGAGHVARCYLYDERADGQKPIVAQNAPRVSLEAVARTPQELSA